MMKKILFFLFNLLMFPTYVHASNIEQANLAFEQGRFEESVQHWQIILKETQTGTTQHIESLIGLANAYHALGFYDKSCQQFQIAFHVLNFEKEYDICEQFPQDESLTKQIKNTTQPILMVKILMGIGDFYLATQQKDKAEQPFTLAESIIKTTQQPQLLAQVLNKKANWLMMHITKREEALKIYQDGLKFAQKANDPELIAKIKLNIAQAMPSQNKNPSKILNVLKEAFYATQTLPPSHLKSLGLIALSQLPYTRELKIIFKRDSEKQQQLFEISYYALKHAQESAKQTSDDRALSYALGFLGQLYEQKQRYHEAISLTRQALFYAQKNTGVTPLPLTQQTSCVTQPISSPMPEITYRWYWQLARLFKAQENREEAIKQYQLAVNHLSLVRSQLRNTGYRYKPYKFEEKFAPLYLEFIELLFQKVKEGKKQQGDLQKVRDAIELLKEDEIKDYFQLDCINKEKQTIEELPPNTAVFYPLFLKQDLKLLLNLSNDSKNHLEIVDASILASEIKAQARDFRGHIISSNKENQQKFMNESSQLYDSLIKPIEEILIKQKIQTLIIVPDGVLRTIPFAALHDGKQFLIEKYTLAMTQGMNLIIDKQPPHWYQSEVFLSGVSESVQGFEPLPNVKEELAKIQAIYPHTHSRLLDNEFTQLAFETQLRKNTYNIVHIASHANFDGKPEQTFLLTHDGKIHLDELENIIKSRKSDLPLELITLSACETAKGDDRAALGLAGITIKAGAKSALASLWQVNDPSTAQFMPEFYQQLLLNIYDNPKMTKAQALQQTQIQMMKMKEYQHPYYWAAFILIGNWL